MGLMLEGLDLLGSHPSRQEGEPMRLPLDAIDEDPGQPRFEFDEEALHELAQTIRERGVRQPISVRPSPVAEVRWMLNFGARRLRASKLAGCTDIPAFVDISADSYDQVIENEQREGLKPLELALFIQRRLAAGDSQAEIARRIGKSRAYVTYATALIDAPDWLLAAYREGRCRGLKELHELRKLAGEHPQAVEAWASDREAITRNNVTALRAQVSEHSASSLWPSTQAPAAIPPFLSSTPSAPPASSGPSETKARNRAVLQARLDGEIVRIDPDHVPSQAGHVFVRRSAEASPMPVEASRLALLGFDAADGRSTV
jgi:ParB family transcriptional regulator, chromosome partitioning protein